MPSASRAQPSKPSPTLLPREHGAYVELLAPLLTALLFLPISFAGAAYAVAGCAIFLAHEPLLILLGRRGERTRAQVSAAARRRLGSLVALGVLGLSLGLWLASEAGRLAVLVPALLSAMAAGLVAMNREKRLGSELFIAVTLASFSLPVLVSAGLSLIWAAWLTLGWSLIHALGTLTGRAFVYRKRDGGKLLARTGVGVLLLSASAPLLWWLAPVPLSWCFAAAPFAILLALFRLGVFQPRSPKPVGWALAAANVAALVLFGLGLLELA